MYKPTVKRDSVYSIDDLRQDSALARLEGKDKPWDFAAVERFQKSRNRTKVMTNCEETPDTAVHDTHTHGFEGITGEVADLLIAGATERQIARTLHTTVKHVRKQMDTIRESLTD